MFSAKMLKTKPVEKFWNNLYSKMVHREQFRLKQIAFCKLWKAMKSWLSKQSWCKNQRCNHTFNVFEMLNIHRKSYIAFITNVKYNSISLMCTIDEMV